MPPRLTRCVRQCMQEFVTPTHSGISDSSWWACHPLLLPGMCTLTYFHHWMSHPCTYGHQQRTHKISSTLNLLHIPPFGRRSESFTCTIYTKMNAIPHIFGHMISDDTWHPLLALRKPNQIFLIPARNSDPFDVYPGPSTTKRRPSPSPRSLGARDKIRRQHLSRDAVPSLGLGTLIVAQRRLMFGYKPPGLLTSNLRSRTN